MINSIRAEVGLKHYVVALLLLFALSPVLVSAPIHDAVVQRDGGLLNSLIAEGVNLNQLDGFGYAALHWAVRDNQLSTIETLLDAGANVNVRSSRGETPLHLAVFSGRVPIITVLLENDALVDVVNGNGDTPLHIASAATNVRVTELLIQYGATTTQTNSSGKRAVDLFEQNSPQRTIVNEGLLRDGYDALSNINLIGSTAMLVGGGTFSLTLFDESGNSPTLVAAGVNEGEIQNLGATFLGLNITGAVGLLYGAIERLVNESLYSQIDERDQDDETRSLLTTRYYDALLTNSIVFTSIGGASALVLMITDVLDVEYIPVLVAAPAFWFAGLGITGLILGESTVVRSVLLPVLSAPIAFLPTPNGVELLIRY